MRQSQNVDVLIVSNRYDHLGRRVQKITPEATYTYFYDGWLLVKEVVERSGDTRRCGVSPRHCGGAGSSTSLEEDTAGSRVSMEDYVIEYHWGKDLSGTIGGAGGVGGLLYVKINGVIYIPWYDAYGNIMGYWDAEGHIVAEYTYDAFGKLIASSGPMADAFSLRYSTKYFDSETGFYYYGYRFYSPELMRWITRDPIGEAGGVNLYAMCENMMHSYDALGLSKYWDNYMNFDKYRTSEVWEKVGGNIYWMHLSNFKFENSCALRVSRALVNSGETIPAAIGRWVAKDYTILNDTVSRQGILFKKGTVLHAEKSGSRYELSAEKMQGCLDAILTKDKLKEKKRFIQNSKATKYAEEIANCNDEAFFVGYSTEGRWWHAGMVKKGYQDPHLFKGLMYVTFWRLKK